jgi:hypothetical protein
MRSRVCLPVDVFFAVYLAPPSRSHANLPEVIARLVVNCYVVPSARLGVGGLTGAFTPMTPATVNGLSNPTGSTQTSIEQKAGVCEVVIPRGAVAVTHRPSGPRLINI